MTSYNSLLSSELSTPQRLSHFDYCAYGQESLRSWDSLQNKKCWKGSKELFHKKLAFKNI